jgi:hypothetical protein
MHYLHQIQGAVSSKDRKMHLERILCIISFPYYYGGLILGIASFLISFAILLYFEKSYQLIWIFLMLSALISLQSVGVIWARNKMKLFEDTFINIVEWSKEDMKKLYGRQVAIIFDDKKMIIAGICAVIIAYVLGADHYGFPFQGFLNIFFNIIYYFAIYTMGIGLYVMIMTASAVHKIGSLPLTANVLFSKDIQAIGILYSEFTVYAAIIYITWVIFLILTPLKLPTHERTIGFLIFALLLCAYFVLPQHGIHEMMVRTKREKTYTFSSQLRAVANDTFKDPNDVNVFSLTDLLDIQCRLDEMSEWPFSFYEILHIALITIIPLIVLSLELLHGVTK